MPESQTDRYGAFGATARRLLDVAAVMAEPFTMADAATVLEVRTASLMEAVAEVVNSGLLVVSDARLAFADERCRVAWYREILDPTCTFLHRRVAALYDERCEYERAADHLLQSSPDGDREALDLLWRAARALAGRAPGRAADYLVRALRTAGSEHPLWPELCAETTGLLASLGRVYELAQLAEAPALQGLV